MKLLATILLVMFSGMSTFANTAGFEIELPSYHQLRPDQNDYLNFSGAMTLKNNVLKIFVIGGSDFSAERELVITMNLEVVGDGTYKIKTIVKHKNSIATKIIFEEGGLFNFKPIMDPNEVSESDASQFQYSDEKFPKRKIEFFNSIPLDDCKEMLGGAA
jgi:hypothetical protein